MAIHNRSINRKEFANLRLRQPYGLVLEPHLQPHHVIRAAVRVAARGVEGRVMKKVYDPSNFLSVRQRVQLVAAEVRRQAEEAAKRAREDEEKRKGRRDRLRELYRKHIPEEGLEVDFAPIERHDRNWLKDAKALVKARQDARILENRNGAERTAPWDFATSSGRTGGIQNNCRKEMFAAVIVRDRTSPDGFTLKTRVL